MKIKTMELTGAALDWAVAKCEGEDSQAFCYYAYDNMPLYLDEAVHPMWQPSTNWAQGGPIIERERISVLPADEDLGTYWGAGKRSTKLYTGDTHLIAAMRYYVGCTLGDEVDIPEGLA